MGARDKENSHAKKEVALILEHLEKECLTIEKERKLCRMQILHVYLLLCCPASKRATSSK